MPKRTDIHTILIPGSGPIVIGQAAEFDYSGTQALKVLREQGYRVILVNSNPATIMTDPDLADVTYIEPTTPEVLEAIIAQERPDAMLPTVGGQTGLNLALALSENGVLARYGVTLLGASLESIRAAEDRLVFRETMVKAGLPIPAGGPATSLAEAEAVAQEAGYPLLVRASFALGGSGASWVYRPEELAEAVRKAIAESPIGQAWIEQSIMGWKEYELEVMRDRADNFVVVCSIENLDPMGVHTGDSITVAPAQTLTDPEYQVLRDLARKVMTAVGVETGGSNVQFAVDPRTGRTVIIEMNPRVSRSSALASKATGFPIAKIAALVAVGYTLDEIVNDITRVTRAAFEPSLDYVVVKIPRWAFEKFPGVDPTLGPQMKSVGEVMALGSTFAEALNKAVQSLEIGVDALDGSGPGRKVEGGEWRVEGGIHSGRGGRALLEELKRPSARRLFAVYRAIRGGVPVSVVAEATGMDPWFLAQLAEIAEVERKLSIVELPTLAVTELCEELSDPHLASGPSPPRRGLGRGFCSASPSQANGLRRQPSGSASSPSKGKPGEGAQSHRHPPPTPAPRHSPHLPTRRHLCRRVRGTDALFVQRLRKRGRIPPHRPPQDPDPRQRAKPHRPGRRVRLLLLPGRLCPVRHGFRDDHAQLQPGDGLHRLRHRRPAVLRAADAGARAERGRAGTARRRDRAVRRADAAQPGRWARAPGRADPRHGARPRSTWPRTGSALPPCWPSSTFRSLPTSSPAPLPRRAQRRGAIGYPVLVRPSYVLGGRAMAVVTDESQLQGFVEKAFEAAPGQPLLIDQFMEDAYEIDVDALADGERVVIGAIMQHIEEAGVHSGDSACVLPPYKVSAYHLDFIRDYTERLGLALNVRGLMNVQFAIKDDVVYVLEVNPRASRTVPFASKATGLPLARIAAQVMAGQTLAELGVLEEPEVDGFFVKEAVLPFKKLPGADAMLGPEMRCTGEVMGHAARFGHAFAKAQLAAGMGLPLDGHGADQRQRLRQGRRAQDRARPAPHGFQLCRHPRHRRLPAPCRPACRSQSTR